RLSPVYHDAPASKGSASPPHLLRCVASAPVQTTNYRLAPSHAARGTTPHTADLLISDWNSGIADRRQPLPGTAAASGTDARPSNTAPASVIPLLPAPRAVTPAPGAPFRLR